MALAPGPRLEEVGLGFQGQPRETLNAPLGSEDTARHPLLCELGQPPGPLWALRPPAGRSVRGQTKWPLKHLLSGTLPPHPAPHPVTPPTCGPQTLARIKLPKSPRPPSPAGSDF